MIAQISPQETFPIVYVLSDPNDTGTYYVRSVLRNSATGAVINIANTAFVNLTNQGNRRFTKNISAPNDPGGQGLWIDITTTVYTDSGYTTKSDVYAEQNDRFLVQVRWNTGLGVGGGGYSNANEGASSIDYKKIKELMIEVVKENPVEIDAVDLDPVLNNFGSLHERITKLQNLITAIDIPQPQKLDLSLVLRGLEGIKTMMKPVDIKPILDAIDALEFPETPDLIPHVNKIHSALKEVRDLSEEGRKSLKASIEKINEKPQPNFTHERMKRLAGHPGVIYNEISRADRLKV